MSLKPLFESETHDEHLRTIEQNMAFAGGRLFSSRERLVADKLELMEKAVKIKDESHRDAFVSLIHKWAYVAETQVEAYDAIRKVRMQVESLISERADRKDEHP